MRNSIGDAVGLTRVWLMCSAAVRHREYGDFVRLAEAMNRSRPDLHAAFTPAMLRHAGKALKTENTESHGADLHARLTETVKPYPKLSAALS